MKALLGALTPNRAPTFGEWAWVEFSFGRYAASLRCA